MTLGELNALEPAAAREAFLRCCGSSRWAESMAAERPFAAKDDLLDAADRVWTSLQPGDWEEAFAAHPRLGDMAALKRKFSGKEWASQEQAGAADAPEATLKALSEGNAAYEKRFGRVFLLCATGKSAEEMLESLRARLENDPGRELLAAAGEQSKITRIRLEKLLS